MKKLRWFITRNLVRIANKIIPSKYSQYVLELTYHEDIDEATERAVCNKIREKLQSLKKL